MAHRSEVLDDLKGKVFVRVKQRHLFVRFVFLNLPVDLASMPSDVLPRIEQVGGLERRKVSQDFGITRAESSPRFERPDGNPRASDSRRVAANARVKFDTGKLIGQVRRYPDKETSPFLTRQRHDGGLSLFKGCRHELGDATRKRWRQTRTGDFRFAKRCKNDRNP